MPNATDQDLLLLTADIVLAQVAANQIDASEVAPLIAAVHAALSELGAAPAAPPAAEPVKGAVSARASIKPDGLISMIDGRKYKTLKRHLRTHGYTPESYRAAFGLASSYPMVSEAYSTARRELAHASGLGRRAVAEPATQASGAIEPALASARQHLGNAAAGAVETVRKTLSANLKGERRSE